MDTVREYLIGVIAAAILCSIVTNILDSKSMVGTAMKLMAGLLMLLAVVRPWVSIRLDSIFDWTDSITSGASSFAADGEMMAKETYRQSIIRQTQAYIEDEAKALNCELTVEVILSEGSTPIPIQVKLTGEVSPYARQVLSAMLKDEINIDLEDQIWA